MTPESRTVTHDRLTDLVVELSGAGRVLARNALDEALARNGDAGDQLLNVADAIVILRSRPAAVPAPR